MDSPKKKAPAKKVAKKAPTKKAPAAKAPAKKAAKKAPTKKLRGQETITGARRLGGWDFATWRMASDDPVMRSTIIGLLVLEKSPDWDLLCDRFERATRLAPVLRSKVVEGPLDLQTPRVVVDPDFDLGYHMRRFSMPEATWDDILTEARRHRSQITSLRGEVEQCQAELHRALTVSDGVMQLHDERSLTAGQTLYHGHPP